MASRIFRLISADFSTGVKIFAVQVRYGHHLRGKPPTVARTLEQRLDELNKKDPALSFKVDIGLPMSKSSRREATDLWMTKMKTVRTDPEFERQSRNRLLSIDLEEAREIWFGTIGPAHIRRIVEHYGIFRDLYGDAYFAPVVPLKVDYFLQNEMSARVYTGNVVKPVEACKQPNVKYAADGDTLWTLAMTTPDGNMQNSSNEYCHWLIGNIPGNQIDHGEEIIDYLQPIPAQGAGYYRYVFVLYKQHERLDYTEYRKSLPCTELKERDWNTLEFYRRHQDSLTPAGIVFFQADWDPSVTQFYHSTLDTKEPVFQYDFPKPYIKPQVWFPIREPFNLYLDKYRDPKEISKEFLLRKFKNVHPFKGPKPVPKYPNAQPLPKDTPTWLKLEKTKSRLGWGRINDIN